MADWCDKRTAHPDPDADWDRTNGRIYRIRPAKADRPKVLSPASLKASQPADRRRRLVDRLFSPDGWHARRALRMLAERRDSRAVPLLLSRLHATHDPIVALRCLWGIHASGGFDERLAAELLGHPAEAVRAWTIRFLGDEHNVTAAIEERLRQIGASDPSPVVLAQLACSAKRLPALCGLRIAARVAENPVSAKDRYIPLLTWWAVESHATADRPFAVETVRLEGGLANTARFET